MNLVDAVVCGKQPLFTPSEVAGLDRYRERPKGAVLCQTAVYFASQRCYLSLIFFPLYPIELYHFILNQTSKFEKKNLS